jgi:orotidine-5'-phosphate decarboxylase
MVQNRSSGVYSSGSGSPQTSEETSEQEQQAYYSPPWTPVAELVVNAEEMRADGLGLSPHEPQLIRSDLGIPSKNSCQDTNMH